MFIVPSDLEITILGGKICSVRENLVILKLVNVLQRSLNEAS